MVEVTKECLCDLTKDFEDELILFDKLSGAFIAM